MVSSPVCLLILACAALTDDLYYPCMVMLSTQCTHNILHAHFDITVAIHQLSILHCHRHLQTQASVWESYQLGSLEDRSSVKKLVCLLPPTGARIHRSSKSEQRKLQYFCTTTCSCNQELLPMHMNMSKITGVHCSCEYNEKLAQSSKYVRKQAELDSRCNAIMETNWIDQYQ